MSKFEPLWKYIAEHQPTMLTFSDVERVCGIPVDHSFLRFKKELEEYGFKIGKISMKEKTIMVEKFC